MTGGRFSLATFVGSTALIAALLVAGLILGWRELADDATSPAATAATPTGEVVWGATEVTDGIPTGFQLDGAGAVAAATTALAVMSSREVSFSDEAFAAAGNLLLDRGELDRQTELVAGTRRELDDAGWADEPESRRLYHFATLAATPRRVTPDRAVVDVWGMTVLGLGEANGASFSTTTVDLVAMGGSWRVVRFDSVDGPTPAVPGSPSPAGALRLLLADALPTLPLPLLETTDAS